ncbi:UDP binding domain-containing protein, partial [Pantoea endophytica]
VLDQVKQALAECLTASGKRASDVTIACFGLAFKPNIDDLRESPAMSVAHRIAEWHSGATWVVEPHVEDIPQRLAHEATLVATDVALQQADILVMLVDHAQFRAIDAAQIAQPWIVDTKGVWR